MRIPFTKYGWPEVVVLPAVVFAVMVTFLAGSTSLDTGHKVPLWVIVTVEIILAIILILVLSFFRDPYRPVPSEADQSLLLAPADGRITDIETVRLRGSLDVDEPRSTLAVADASLPPRKRASEARKDGDALDWIKSAGADRALRIGIFLSIFDAHINRAPCNAKVEKITYRQGAYKNAMNPKSARLNESNNLGLTRTNNPQDRLMVRQISGAIARRIVCEVRQGQELASGQKFGMIKFGSRTELYVPARDDVKCLVQVGDRIKAGLTPLVRYDKLTAESTENSEKKIATNSHERTQIKG